MEMQKSKILKVILFLCGAAVLVAGSIALFSPVGFTARNGIDLGDNLSLFNDYRSMGGLLAGTGIVILLGIIHKGMTFTSTVVAAVVLSVFSIGRILSIVMDGMPADGIVKATVVETVLSLLAIFALVKYRVKK